MVEAEARRECALPEQDAPMQAIRIDLLDATGEVLGETKITTGRWRVARVGPNAFTNSSRQLSRWIHETGSNVSSIRVTIAHPCAVAASNFSGSEILHLYYLHAALERLGRKDITIDYSILYLHYPNGVGLRLGLLKNWRDLFRKRTIQVPGHTHIDLNPAERLGFEKFWVAI